MREVEFDLIPGATAPSGAVPISSVLTNVRRKIAPAGPEATFLTRFGFAYNPYQVSRIGQTWEDWSDILPIIDGLFVHCMGNEADSLVSWGTAPSATNIGCPWVPDQGFVATGGTNEWLNLNYTATNATNAASTFFVYTTTKNFAGAMMGNQSVNATSISPATPTSATTRGRIFGTVTNYDATNPISTDRSGLTAIRVNGSVVDIIRNGVTIGTFVKGANAATPDLALFRQTTVRAGTASFPANALCSGYGGVLTNEQLERIRIGVDLIRLSV